MKPTIKHFVSISLPISIILIGIFSVLSFYTGAFPLLSYFENTTIWWAISFFILIIFFLSKKYFFDEKNRDNTHIITLYLFWIIVCIIRGMFVADGYWGWKGLVTNIMGLLLPIVAYSATNKVIVQSILSFYVKYGLPIFILLIFLIRTDAYGFYLMPVSFLLLFLPALSSKQKYLILAFTAIVILADLGARSNVLKFGVPLLVLIIYYLKDKISVKVLETIRLTLIIAPFVFLVLGVSGVFNVFKISDYFGQYEITGTDNDGKRVKLDISVDTRTFIYVEVIQSAIKNDYWIFGRTPARGNDSEIFGAIAYVLTGRHERLANEVGVANIFTWTGVVGLILYMLVFFRASYLAINRSRNIYAKMLGIYIAFRWLYSWVEDVSNFSLNYFMLWIMIGLCFSFSFRMMSDYEVSLWIRGVFDHRYLHFEKYFKREKDGK